MLYALAVGLVVCGFMLGWHARPLIAEMLLNMMCHCGSDKKWQDCCHDRDVAEYENR